MDSNYWKEYWDNYYKFMAVYLSELQNAYPNVDIRNEYLEVASLFEPSKNLEDYDGENYINLEDDREPPIILPIPGPGPVINPFTPPGGGQFPTPSVSPGGGQFTINNCRRRAIVRIVMRRGFNPSEFYLIVDKADNRSIQGFRIACEGGRVRFISMAVEYRNINLIECAF